MTAVEIRTRLTVAVEHRDLHRRGDHAVSVVVVGCTVKESVAGKAGLDAERRAGDGGQRADGRRQRIARLGRVRARDGEPTSLKVATPFTVVTVSVPASVSSPGFAPSASVTAVGVDQVAVAVFHGHLHRRGDGVARRRVVGCTVKASVAAAAGVMVKAVLVTAGSVPTVAVRV